jgi:hypothetical protein
MHNHTRWLIDHDDVPILVHDLERERLGDETDRLRRGQVHSDRIASMNGGAGARLAIVQKHLSGFDQALSVGAREIGHVIGDIPV